jgi:hypothetical protein
MSTERDSNKVASGGSGLNVELDAYINLYKDCWTAHDTAEIAYDNEEPGCLYVAVPASFASARKPTSGIVRGFNDNDA